MENLLRIIRKIMKISSLKKKFIVINYFENFIQIKNFKMMNLKINF